MKADVDSQAAAGVRQPVRSCTRIARLAFVALLAAVAWGGVWVTVRTARSADQEMRARLLTEARMLARAVPAADLRSLDGSREDLARDGYRRLKALLVGMRSANPASRFFYVMGRRADGRVFVHADSEPPESSDYSPPGDPYNESSAELQNVFASGQATTEGPLADRWGTWVSALAPIHDGGPPPVTAVFGMDVDARDWGRSVVARCIVPAAASALVMLLSVVFLLLHGRAQRETERLHAYAAALKDSHTQSRTVLDTVQAGVVIVDAESRAIVDINDSALSLIGATRDAAVGRVCHTFICPSERHACPVLDLNQEVDCAERWLCKADGGRIPVLKTVSALKLNGRKHLIESFLDISALKAEEVKRRVAQDLQQEMAMRLQRQQRLASLGTLARGMAHAINNPLTGIMNYAELVKMEAAGSDRLATMADAIVVESRRVATITHSLLDYSQQREGAAEDPRADVAEVVASAASGMSGKDACLHVDLAMDLAPVVCPRGQLMRVVAALLANAREASRGAEAPITVTARPLETPAGTRIRLTVEDRGTGISADILERVCEPFFTTKDRTRHAGLGLWVCRSILLQCGGDITVESGDDAWTRVSVDLPLASTA